jgi:hypothetical protein
VTGTDVKTALDKLIDGLATGRARLLAKAGVVVDATKANEEYAKSIGVNVDQLTQEDKLHALQIAALTKMKDKQKELGDESITFAQEFLREWNEIVNMINRGVAALGRFKLHEEDSLELAKRIDAQRAAAAQERGAAADAALEAAGADLNEGGQDVGLPGQIRTGLEGRGAMAGGPKRDKAGEAAAEKARRDRVFLDNILKGASGSGYASQGGPIGGDMTGYLMDKDTGEGGAQKLIADYEKIQKEMLAKQDSRLSAAGIKKGGLLSKLMFGESTDEHGDPSEDFIQKVKGTSDVALQLMADISQASQEMAHAAGASIEAAIGGAQSESLKRIVHDQLMALGTKYQIRALEFAAEGAGFLVYGDVPQAALAFEAAGLWEGAAVAAGLGARAVGTGGAGGNAGRPSTSSPAVNRGSGIPSSTIGTPANNNGQPQSIVINQTILPGGEAEAGRRVREALNADYSKTGMIPMGH